MRLVDFRGVFTVKPSDLSNVHFEAIAHRHKNTDSIIDREELNQTNARFL